jgi:PAS domain S-box-containing protein
VFTGSGQFLLPDDSAGLIAAPDDKMPAFARTICNVLAASRTSPGNAPVPMRIRSNLLLLTTIGFGALVIFASLAFTALLRVEINGPVYRQISLSKDLVSDYVPPSESLLEAVLICSLMNEGHGPAEFEHDLRLFQAAQNKFEKQYADYMQRLPEGKLKAMMRGTAYQTAQQYFQIAQQEFIPLVKQGDHEKAREVLVSRMNPIYETHAPAVGQIVNVASQEAREGEALAAKLIHFYMGLMVGGGLLILVAGGVLASAIARGISKQTGELIRSEERFSKIFRRCPISMAIVAFGGGIVDLNDAWMQRFGITLEEAVGQSIDELGLSVEPSAKLREELAAGGYKIQNRERQIRTRSGQVLTSLVSAEVIHIAGEPHLGIVGMSERATLLGGSLGVTSAPGEGTTITLTVPLFKRQETASHEHS